MVDCGPKKSFSYKLTMTAPPTCNDEVLSIDPTHAVFQVPPAVTKTYSIGAGYETIDWSDTDVTSLYGLSCGSLDWTFENTVGGTPDSIVFTFTSSTTHTITIQTSDLSKANTYNLRVTVSFSSYPAITASKDFDVVVQDPCGAATLTIASSIIHSTITQSLYKA